MTRAPREAGGPTRGGPAGAPRRGRRPGYTTYNDNDNNTATDSNMIIIMINIQLILIMI